MAGRFSVEAVFKAIDRVTAPVSRMQNRVGKFTRAMERGLRRVNRATSAVARGLLKAGKSLAKFGTVAIAAVGTGLVLAINRVADSADALAKRTRRLKFPIKEFQEWQFVAEQSGISTDEFDKSIEKFTKSVGEAKAGTGTLITILKKSNPQLLKQITSAKSASEAFDLYLEAMRGTEDQTVKTALATAAFGRTGAKFINITEQSTDAIKALRMEQRENGVITEQQANAAEAYNDAVNSLKRSLGGLLQNVILPMLPAITKTVRQWREWIVTNKEMLTLRITQFLTGLKDRFFDLVDAVKEFNSKYNLIDLFGQTVSMIAKLITFLTKNGDTVLKVTATVVALAVALKVLAGIMAIVNLVMLANPIGLIIVAVTALIAVVTAAIVWWDELKAAFLSIPGPVKAAIAILAGPIGWLIGAAALVMENWEPIKSFFSDLWSGVVDIFNSAVKRIMSIVDMVKNATASIVNTISSIGSGVASFFGFDDDKNERSSNGTSQVVSPQERVARSIEEQRTTSTAEVTIRDESGRAEVTNGRLGNGLSLQPSGAF